MMGFAYLRHYNLTRVLPALISVFLLVTACTEKNREKPPSAFNETLSQSNALLNQLMNLNTNEISQLEVRVGRLLIDQDVLNNKDAEESLRASLDFLSSLAEELEEVKTKIEDTRSQMQALQEEWQQKKDMRPMVMERFFLQQQKLNNLSLKVDYLVNRWNAQLMNIEMFEQAFPQGMDQ